MKRKRLGLILFGIAAATLCTVGLAACGAQMPSCTVGGKDLFHQHSWSSTYTEDGDTHYQTCSGCNEKQYSDHSYNSDDTCICGKTKYNNYKIVFDANGGKFAKGDIEIDDDITLDDGSVVSADGKKMTVTVSKGDPLFQPLRIPERRGYVFDGWFTDAKCENEYVFDLSPVSGKNTLYAKWSISFNFTLSENKSYYIVSGIGGLSGDVEVPETYNLLPVLEIGEGAFKNCSKLTSIVVADSVTKIGASAFAECKNLTKVTLGKGTLKIGDNAFDAGFTGSGLEEIYIPATVEYIGKDVFSVCSNLKKINFGGTINDWCKIDFTKNTVDSLSVLGNSGTILYVDEKPVTELIINTEKINDLAFTNYDALKSVTIGANVKTIGKQSFAYSGLSTLNLDGANSLSEIGVGAFSYTSVKSLKLPASCTYVAESAFSHCNSLTSVDLGGAKRIDKMAFKLSTAITSLDLGVVEEIEDEAFGFYENSVNVTIPASLWYIGNKNFSNVTSVKFASSSDWYANFSQNVSKGSSLSTADKVVEFSAEKLSNAKNAANYFGLSGSYGYNDCDWVKKAGEIQYSVSGSKATVTGVNVTETGGIYVPKKYNNVPVTNVDNYAFSNEFIKAVSLSDNVSEIASGAFSDNTELQLICNNYNSQHFTVIDGVLYNKEQTQIIQVPKKLRGNVFVPDTITDIGKHFKGCIYITQITTTVTSVDNDAFLGCRSLERLILTMVENLPDGLLSDCVNLKEIIIPNIKDSLYAEDFDSCNNLENIDVGSNCEYYCSYEGVLYNKDRTTIIYVPQGLRILNMPATVYEINWNGGSSLREVNIIGINDEYSSRNGLIYNKDFTEILYIPKGIIHFIILSDITDFNFEKLNDCHLLTNISVAKGNDNYASYGGIIYNKDMSNIIYVPKGICYVTIPDSVTSIGERAFWGCNGLTSITVGENNTAYASQDGILYNKAKTEFILIPADLSGVVIIPDGVTSIGDYAFYYCSGLTSITIPDGVTSIGYQAFYNCSSLTSVTIGKGVTSIGDDAFLNCSGLTSITIPDSVTSIGDSAFYGCSSLTSVTIGNGVTSIGGRAFDGCSGLTTITIPDSVTSIGDMAFSNCNNLQFTEYNNALYLGNTNNPYVALINVNNKEINSLSIGNNTKVIYCNAFSGCSGLTSITIPDSVTSIGGAAFKGCTGLTSITIPDSVTSIGGAAFRGCSGLTSITIGNGVTSIGYDAFYYCSGLTSVTIPDGVTSIGEEAFHGCSGLTSITIPDSVTSIGYGAFWSCSSLTSVTIPNSVTSIGIWVFRFCSGLTSITIPDSVTSIDAEAFSGCSGLTSITIPENVMFIGDLAFAGCSGLEIVTVENGNTNYHSAGNCLIETAGKTLLVGCKNSVIPTDGSVTSIGQSAFKWCSGLMSITIPDSVTSIGMDAFRGCSGLTSITFNGTVEQWNAITKYGNWNKNTGDFTITCTDGKLNKDGNPITA